MKLYSLAFFICICLTQLKCQSNSAEIQSEFEFSPLIRKEVIDSFAKDVKKIKSISQQAESDFVYVAMQLNQNLAGYAFFTGTVRISQSIF